MASLSLNPLDGREIWFTNMLLLGFDPDSCEEKFKVSFSRDMFAHISKKGMEVVMHFLFTRLDPQLAHDEFRDCWPVHDKKQEQQFRKICSNWLATIAKEQPDSKLPRLAASLLLSPGGDKFYQFLLRFSSHILRTVCLKEAKSEEKQVFVSSFISSPSDIYRSAQKDVTSAAIKCHMTRHVHHVTRRMQQVSGLHQEWESYASELVSEYRTYSKEGKELAKRLSSLQEEQKQLALMSHGTPTKGLQTSSASNEKVLSLTAEVAAMKRQKRMMKARDFWHSIEDFLSKSSHQREIVESILQGQANKYSFDAKDVVFQIPEMVREEYEHLTRQGKAGNTYEAGKLNLISLVKVWNCALQVLRTQLEETALPLFEAETQRVSQELHTHRANLAAAQKLRASLHEFHESLSASVEQLEERLQTMRPAAAAAAGALERGKHSTGDGPALLTLPTITLPTLGLELLPPSPEKSIAVTPDSKWRQNVTFTADTTSTPEAVQNISRSIHLATRRTHTKPPQTPTAQRQVDKPSASPALPGTKLADLSIFTDSPSSSLSLATPSASTQHQRRANGPPKIQPTRTTSERVAKTGVKTKKNRTIKPAAPGVGKPTPAREDSKGKKKTVKTEQAASKGDFRKQEPSAVQTPLMQSYPLAYDLLADEIASAVAAADVEGASSPNTPDTDIHSLIDPISAMGREAFVSNDKIARTPLAKQPASRLQAMQSVLSPVLQSPTISTPLVLSSQPPNHALLTPSESPNKVMEESLRQEVAAQESCFQEHSVSPEQTSSAEKASSPEVSVSGSASPETLQSSFGRVDQIPLDSTFAHGVAGSPMLSTASGESPPLETPGSQASPAVGFSSKTPSVAKSLLQQEEHDSYMLPTVDLLSFTPQAGSVSQVSLKSARRSAFDPNSATATPSKPINENMISFSPALSKAAPLLQTRKTPYISTQPPPIPSIAFKVSKTSPRKTESHLEPSLTTPTQQSPGLFASIEPPTPFRHADFDLDSSPSSSLSGEEQMLSELDNSGAPPLLQLGSSPESPLNLTESPIFVLDRQSQIDGDLLDLGGSLSAESSALHSSLVMSPPEQLIDLESS